MRQAGRSSTCERSRVRLGRRGRGRSTELRKAGYEVAVVVGLGVEEVMMIGETLVVGLWVVFEVEMGVVTFPCLCVFDGEISTSIIHSQVNSMTFARFSPQFS